MFSKETRKFGSLEALIVRHSNHQFQIEVIPEIGAHLRSLTIKGINIIEGATSEDDLIHNNAYKSTILAPFPNRIKDGKYQIDGQTFQLDINEKPLNNALHGLVYKSSFSVKDISLNDEKAIIEFTNHYNGEDAGFPFAFDTEIIFELDIKKGFSCRFTFTNKSEKKIPFGYGWHPYLQFGDDVDDLMLKLPPVNRFKVNDQMIPEGEPTIYHEFDKPNSLNDVSLDDCFEITKTGEICETFLKSGKGISLRLWQETGEKKLNYLQIFTPPHRKSIAIEPQTCCIDAFNNKQGLFFLKSKERIEASFGLEVVNE